MRRGCCTCSRSHRSNDHHRATRRQRREENGSPLIRLEKGAMADHVSYASAGTEDLRMRATVLAGSEADERLCGEDFAGADA